MLQCVRFDRRNAFLLNGASYATARECEAKLRRPPGNMSEIPVCVWTRIDSARGKKLAYNPPPQTYSRMLRRMYQTLTLGLVAAAGAVAIFGLPSPTTTKQARVTVSSGVVLCGHIIARGEDRIALALKDSGNVRFVLVRDLRRVQERAC
jgi:hypothetical protein